MEFDVLTLFTHLTVLIAACAVLGILRRVNEWYHVNYKLGEKKKKLLPPGDMGWPLLGNLLSFLKSYKSKDPDSFINNLINRYGRTGIYKTYLFGSPSVIVCLPETCKPVLMDQDRFWVGYPASTTRLTGKRSFHGISNAEHKRLRKITTSLISGHKSLSVYIKHIEGIVITALDEWASTDRPIEFLTETRKVAFKVITHVFLGSSSQSVLNTVEKHYIDMTTGIRSLAINVPGFAFHRAFKARNSLVKILRGVLDERRAMKVSNEEKAMIDLLMELDDEDGRQLEDEDIVDLLLVFLLAGHETTAHSAMWAVLFLHQNPEILQMAREEQQEMTKRRSSNQRGLTLKEIREMPYLDKVIDETLRRANVSFSIFRKANVDVNINGYLIPKGWKVLVWTRGVHMDSETYCNPKEFLPSRLENYTPKPGALIPFGAGSRVCPGADLAKLEISIFLHYFLLDYKLEQLNPESPCVYLPLPRPADKCLAKITKLK